MWMMRSKISGAFIFSFCDDCTKRKLSGSAADYVWKHAFPMMWCVAFEAYIKDHQPMCQIGEKSSSRNHLSRQISLSASIGLLNRTLLAPLLPSCPIYQLIIIFIWPSIQCPAIISNYHHMLERPEDALSNLKKIADVCRSTNTNAFTGSVLGVIVDATRPLYRERDKDYIVELKIVDENINETQVYGILVKYCSVYVFGKDRAELEVVNQVGQLLYLSHFTFALWNDIKLETKYRSTIERLYSFTPEGASLIPFKCLLADSQAQHPLASKDFCIRANNLSNWFLMNYFYNQYRPSLGINLVNNYCVMAEPFSMVLKVAPKQPAQSEELQKQRQEKMQKEKEKQKGIAEEEIDVKEQLVLQDSNGNTFLLSGKYLPTTMPEGKYVLVRSISHIGNFYEIHLTETGCLLGLPVELESQYWQQMNYCGISRFNERFLLRNHKTCNLSKINYVSPKVTPLYELQKQIDIYETHESRRQHDVRVQDLYMVQAVVINFSGRLLLFHSELQMIADHDYLASLTDDERTELTQKGTLQYLYEGVLGVMDRSTESTGKLLYIHLFSNEKRCRFFQWGLIQDLNKSASQGSNREKEMVVKAQIEAHLQALIDKSDFTNTVSMLLEPIKSDQLLFRLTNTIFL